jgi:hypothetical protein
MPGRRVAVAAAVAVTALIAAAVSRYAVAAGPRNAPARSAPPRTGAVLGDYATPIIEPVGTDGIAHIDDAATIQKLSGAHVDTYAYLIYSNPAYGTADARSITRSQWVDLPGFAGAAARAGINVLVYLVPPTESHDTIDPTTTPAYEPFGWDYQAWSANIARVAVAHPNIRGIVMDDFAENSAGSGSPYAFTFTPQYVSGMRSAGRAIAPWLTLSTIMYYPNSIGSSAILADYRNSIDGIVFPYRDESAGGRDTANAAQAESEGRSVGSVAKCHSGDSCLQIHYPSRTPSTVGQEAGVSQQIEVQGRPHRRTLSFWVNDDFDTGGTSGYHTIQALIDGVVVASEDVNGYTTGWHQLSVDVTSALAGKSSAKLTLRVLENKAVSNFGVSAFFDDVRGTGLAIKDAGFETAGIPAWTPSSDATTFTTGQVHSLSYLFMTYAMRLSNERTRDPAYQTSSAYVATVVRTALDLTSQHVADGSLIYELPLGGGDANLTAEYDDVAALYGAQRGHPATR